MNKLQLGQTVIVLINQNQDNWPVWKVDKQANKIKPIIVLAADDACQHSMRVNDEHKSDFGHVDG